MRERKYAFKPSLHIFLFIGIQWEYAAALNETAIQLIKAIELIYK